MKKYYAVISKESFIKLLKFGRVKSFKTEMLDTSEDNIEIKLKKIFKKIDFLSGEEEEIIILKINNNNTKMNINEWYEINIENIENYYLLSNKAQQFYQSKISSKINFELFPSKNILNDLEEQKEIEDMERGSDILLKQFGFDNEQISNPDILSKEFKTDLRNFLKLDDHLENSYENYYFDLLSYTRKNKFKKEDVSYIYDLIMLLHLEDRQVDKVNRFKYGVIQLNRSITYDLLENNKKENLLGYIKFIEDSGDENIKKFINQIGMNNLVIGTLFLKFKDIKKNNKINEIKEYITLFNTHYKEELIIALYLIGLVFGYEKLRDDYYNYIGCYNFKNEDNIANELFKNDRIIYKKSPGLPKKLIKTENIQETLIKTDNIANELFKNDRIIYKKSPGLPKKLIKTENIQETLIGIKNIQENIADKIFKIMKNKINNLNKKINRNSISIKYNSKNIVKIETISPKNLKVEISLKNTKAIEKNMMRIDQSIAQLNKKGIKRKYDEKTKKYILNFVPELITSENICDIFKNII